MSRRFSRIFAELIAAILAVFLLGGCDKRSDDKSETGTLVFIIPGTFGNDMFWPNLVSGKATFGSELQRGVGVDCQVVPFLWSGANDHPSREAAAESLAQLIDEKAVGFKRVCLVGHSHGGNIALRAAGLCRTKIDMVICLSTPHLYLRMRAADGTNLSVPVYCSYLGRKNIGTIVNICPVGDSVPDWANVETGLDENQAIPLTQTWQECLDHPRLANDGFIAHLFQDDNLWAEWFLNVADANIRIGTLVGDDIGTIHAAIHSRRVGFVLGQLLSEGGSPAEIAYIGRLVEPQDADAGEPIDVSYEQEWDQLRAADFETMGWRLDKIDVLLLPETKSIVDNWDGSDPYPFVQVTPNDNSDWSLKTRCCQHTYFGTWEQPGLILSKGQTDILGVWSQHDFDPAQCLGRRYLSAGDSPPQTFQADPQNNVFWSANLSWTPVHY
jgi:pimeloyl-ACP methyl ester carboxylesterase